MKTYFAAILLVFAVSADAGAQRHAPPFLDNAELRAAYAGKTHISRYRQHIEDYGGVLFEETYNLDGTLRYEAGDVVATGRWRIEDDVICFQYESDRLLPACFVVFYEAGCFYSYEVLRDETVRGLNDGEWWIRSSLAGVEPDCARDLVS